MDMHKVSAREMEDPRERFEGWVYLGELFDGLEIRVDAMIWRDGFVDTDSKYYIDDDLIPQASADIYGMIDELVLDAWRKRREYIREDACK